MIYNITLVDAEDNIIDINYNVRENKLYGEHIDKFHLDTNFEGDIERPAKRLCISLGFSCNMTCSYCLQSKNKKSKFNKEQADKIVDKLNNMDLSKTKVEFWGGETLLYTEEIKYIVENLAKLPFALQVITNGTKLNMELALWLEKYNFSIAISHDCQGQELRGKDCFEDPVNLEAIRYLAYNRPSMFSINSVISGKNIETVERLRFIEKYIPDYEGGHGGEGPLYNTNIDSLNNDDLHDAIYNDLSIGVGMKYSFYRDGIISFIKSLQKNIPNSKITTKCGVDKDSYSILSMDGKELTCHNYDSKLPLYKFSEGDKCSSCLVSNLCKGSCPIVPKDSDMFKRNCATMYATYSALLRASLTVLSDGKYQMVDVKELSN